MLYDCILQESLIDASEDSQLEAAIRASFTRETYLIPHRQNRIAAQMKNLNLNFFLAVRSSCLFVASDEEEEIENLAKSRKSPHKDLGHRKEENRRSMTEPPCQN